MFSPRRLSIALSVGLSFVAAACGEDPKPAAAPLDANVAAVSDAGGSGLDGGSNGGPNGTEGGSPSAGDGGGAASADSAAPDASASAMTDSGSVSASDAAMSDAGATGDAGTGNGGTFTLTSPAFENKPGCAKDMAAPCAVFPQENVSYLQTAASETMNLSPELNFTGVPAGTKSFAVVLQDLTNGMAHWVLWNIPGTATKLERNVAKASAMPPAPAGAQQCSASFAPGDGYYGPGSRCNVYEFVVYALARPMFSPTPATDAGQVRTQLLALNADILGTATLRGRANYMMMCSN